MGRKPGPLSTSPGAGACPTGGREGRGPRRESTLWGGAPCCRPTFCGGGRHGARHTARERQGQRGDHRGRGPVVAEAPRADRGVAEDDPGERAAGAGDDGLTRGAAEVHGRVRAEDGGDVESAISLLTKRQRSTPASAMAYRKLAVCWTTPVRRASRSWLQRGRPLSTATASPRSSANLAIAYFYSDVDYDPAREMSAYRSVLERDPENTTAPEQPRSRVERRAAVGGCRDSSGSRDRAGSQLDILQ